MSAVITKDHFENEVIDNLIKKLHELQKSGQNYDYELTTEDGGSFKVHKWVLSTSSQFFVKLFNTELRERNTNSIVVHRVSSNVLEKIIDYMYTGKITISSTIAKEIIDTAMFFCMFTLVDKCVQVLIETLNEDNCLDLLKYSETCLSYGADLTKKSLELISKKFDNFINLPDFCELTFDTIKILVDQDRSTYTEEALYLAIRKWITFDMENREQYVETLMNEIKLECFSSNFAKRNIFDDNPLLRTHGFSQKLFDLLNNKWERLGSVSYSDKKLYTVMNDDLKLLDYQKNETSQVVSKIPNNRSTFGYTVFNQQHVMFCGGEIGSQTVDSCVYFSMDEYKWNDLPAMKTARFCPKLATLDNKIYVCSGSASGYKAFIRSAEVFDIQSSTWLELSDLNNDRKKENGLYDVIELNNCIYFVTGDCIQCLDPRESGWKTICTDAMDKDLWSAESYDNYIYGFTCSSIAKFDLRNNKWLDEKVQYDKAYTHFPRTCVMDNKIFVFSRDKEEHYLGTYGLTNLALYNSSLIKREGGGYFRALFTV